MPLEPLIGRSLADLVQKPRGTHPSLFVLPDAPNEPRASSPIAWTTRGLNGAWTDPDLSRSSTKAIVAGEGRRRGGIAPHPTDLAGAA
jgi:hypothetical protein